MTESEKKELERLYKLSNGKRIAMTEDDWERLEYLRTKANKK